MPEKSYYNRLYAFQDEIMKVVHRQEVDFYLTGGTALSRFYLNHRYSDDLDFFINQAPDFKKIETPEIYFGARFKRNQIGNSEGLDPGNVVEYKIPSETDNKHYYHVS